MKHAIIPSLAVVLLTAALVPAAAHDEQSAAGVPGNPKQPARTVTVVMSEAAGAMKFTPDRLDVKKGEQVRFVLENKGALPHEFRLATVKDNDEHAAMMRDMPDMKHHEANAVSLDPGKSAELVWRFTKAGSFEFACLIPGHREAGMHGTVAVK
ncbi:MAG: cupredoxin domain-containing protein [Pseudolabrys sp.]